MYRRSDFQTPIGGTSRLFTSGGRSVQSRIEACRIETQSLTIVERNVDASQFDSLQEALDCITRGTEGCINLNIPDGNYVETLVLSDSSSVKLTLCGSLEPQFGFGFQADKPVIGPAAFGTGVSTLSSVGSIITINNSGDAPDLTLLNIQNGDTIMIQNDAGTIQRRTIQSVTANTITLTSNVVLGATTGSGFVFLPRVHITGSINTAAHIGPFILKGIFVSSADNFGVSSTVAPVTLLQSVIRTVDPEAPTGALFLSGAAIPRSTLQDSALFGSRGLTVERIQGIEMQNMSIYVEASTQDGWAVLMNEDSSAFLENSNVAGQPTGSLLMTENHSFLDIENTAVTVNLPTYDDRAVKANTNSDINLHDGSSVELTDPVGDARHATALNHSRLLVCGEVEFIGNGVLLQSAIEAANGSHVIADHSNITFTSIAAGTEYDVDTKTGITGNAQGAAPIVGPSDSLAIINDKY